MSTTSQPQFCWSPERVALLQRLYDRGLSNTMIAAELNATLIAGEITISKSGVTGKLHRAEIVVPGRDVQARHDAGAPERAKAARAIKMNVVVHVKPSAPKPVGHGTGGSDASFIALGAPNWIAAKNFAETKGPTITGAAPDSLNLRLVDPGGHQGCRWPTMGEGAETRLCCSKIERGSYCGFHASKGYTNAPDKPPTAAKAVDRAKKATPTVEDEPQPLDFERAA